MNRIVLLGLVSSMFFMGTAYATNPSIDYLQKEYKISRDDAENRIGLQGEIIELSEKLNQENNPNYADMYIQHEPVYKIVLLFTNNENRLDFIKSLDPKLRRWVQIKQAKRSRDTYNKELENINDVLRATDISYTAEYDLVSQKYIVTVEDKQHTALVRQALSNIGLQGDFTINLGAIPKIETATGFSQGDKIYAGESLWASSADAINKPKAACTLGYGISYESGGVLKKGILSAGHCPSILYTNISGKAVKLSNPIVRKQHKYDPRNNTGDGISDKYDYQIWDVTGLGVNNQVKYRDLNGIPEFPSSGIFNLTSITSFNNQKVGMVACKSGGNTGITCGTIVNGNDTRDGVAGWIRVGNSSQSNISTGGDSGSPWFLYPGTSNNVNGLGIHIAGLDNPDVAIYMPIDYIDDHISSVNTLKTS